MGIAAIAGWKPRLPLQNQTARERRDALGMVSFGFAYALVSLSCTLGTFLSVSTFAMQRSFVGGIATYVVYAAGMGTIILALSVSAALAHDSLVGTLRNASKYAPRIAGVLLAISGGYAIWYGRYELSVYGGDLSDDSIVQFGTNLQTRFVIFTQSVGATRIALIIVATTAVAYLAFRFRHRPLDTLRTPPPSPMTARSGRATSPSTASDGAPSRETTPAP